MTKKIITDVLPVKSNTPFVLYALARTDESENSISHSFSLHPNIDIIRQRISQKMEGLKDQNSKKDIIPDISDAPDDLTEIGRGVWKFYNRLRSFYELISFVSLVPDAIISGYFDRNIKSFVEKECELIEKIDDYEIRGVQPQHKKSIMDSLDRWNDIDAGFQKLPSSIFLSLISTYDSVFAEYTELLLKSHPERYSGSDRVYSVSEILSLGDVSLLIEKVANDEVNDLMRKNHHDQIEFFEKSFHIGIKNHFKRWNEFIEVFERRNLSAHGNLVVNKLYLNNVSKDLSEKLEIGSLLILDDHYLEHAVDILLEFGILLSFTAWQKQLPKQVDDSYDTIVEVSFSLLQEKRYKLVSRLCEYVSNIGGKKCNDATLRRLIVNHAIAEKMQDEKFDIEPILLKCDWSVCDISFEICLNALRGNSIGAADLLNNFKASVAGGEAMIREWPVFYWLRSDDAFRAEFKKVYDEVL